MSSRTESQDLAFQGLREKIPWYIAATKPINILGFLNTALVAALYQGIFSRRP